MLIAFLLALGLLLKQALEGSFNCTIKEETCAKYCFSLITSIWIYICLICTNAQKVAKMFQMLIGELPTHKRQNLGSLFVLIGYQKSLYSVIVHSVLNKNQ